MTVFREFERICDKYITMFELYCDKNVLVPRFPESHVARPPIPSLLGYAANGLLGGGKGAGPEVGEAKARIAGGFRLGRE